MPEPEFITHDFNLPYHDNELSNAGDKIEKLKNNLDKIVSSVELIKDDEFINFFDDIVMVLDYVGRLSMPVFAIGDNMQEMYKMKFLHAPELAKQLWLDHFENINKPYNLLKNRCFKMMEDLDKYYVLLYDKNPPNWKAWCSRTHYP